MCCRKRLNNGNPGIFSAIKPLNTLRKIAKSQARLGMKNIAGVEEAIQRYYFLKFY